MVKSSLKANLQIGDNSNVSQMLEIVFVQGKKKWKNEIDCTVFIAIFNTISVILAARTPIYVFLESFLPIFHTILLPSHWLLFQITIIETAFRQL